MSDHSAWRGHPLWCITQARFDVAAFLNIWSAWQADPERPRLLHVVAPCDAPPAQQLQALAQSMRAERAPLAELLAQQAWGLLPGVHRLRFALPFESAQLCLTLHVACANDTDPPWSDRSHPLPSPHALAQPAEPHTPSPTADSNASPPASPHPSPYAHPHTHPPPAAPIAIVIGAGLAGAGTAHALAMRGWHVQVLEAGAQPASGASGLPVGLVAPHTSPDDSLISRLSRAGVRSMHHTMQRLLQEGTDWSASGVQERRLPGKTRKGGAPAAWQQSWPEEGGVWTRSAAPPAPAHALWHEKGAWLRPAALVNALLRHPNIRWQGNTPISALTHANGQWQVWQEHTLVAQAAHVVVASGPATKQLIGTTSPTVLPLQALRGQLSWGLLHDSPQAPLPASSVNGHGSFVAPVPTPDGPAWFAGSTYDRQHPHAEVLAADHADNLTRLHALLPDTAAGLQHAFAHTVRGWAGVRASVPDRLPLVGPIAHAPPGLWVNAGMGSRGLTLALLCGELLAARWHQEPLPIEHRLAQALDALRYQTPSTPA